MITSSLVLMHQAADGDGPAINGRHHLCDMSSMRGTENRGSRDANIDSVDGTTLRANGSLTNGLL